MVLKTVEISRRSCSVPLLLMKASKAGVTKEMRLFFCAFDMGDLLIDLKTILATGLFAFPLLIFGSFFLFAVTTDPQLESLAFASPFGVFVQETESTRTLVHVGVWCDYFVRLNVLLIVVILAGHVQRSLEGRPRTFAMCSAFSLT